MAEKEYIEREELLKETVRKIKANNERRMAVVDWEFVDLVNDAPAADVVPRTEVAREIFEELFRYIYKGADIYCIAQEHLLSVEKKYTEGKE